MDTIISAVNIKKSYDKTEILHGVSLDVKRGEVLAIMGPSGSGKSTLLHALASIIDIDGGKVLLNGRRIDNINDNQKTILRRTSFGFVFQFGQLVPELSAEDNVALPLLLNGVNRATAYEEAKKYLDLVGLKDYANSLPGKMSGGQMQRVSIARALVIKPDIIFADEPTGSLDSLNSEKVMELFVNLAKKNNVTIVMVTHEPNIAAYADREVFVHDGKVSTARR